MVDTGPGRQTYLYHGLACARARPRAHIGPPPLHPLAAAGRGAAFAFAGQGGALPVCPPRCGRLRDARRDRQLRAFFVREAGVANVLVHHSSGLHRA
jgi:hypothetical protein